LHNIREDGINPLESYYSGPPPQEPLDDASEELGTSRSGTPVERVASDSYSPTGDSPRRTFSFRRSRSGDQQSRAMSGGAQASFIVGNAALAAITVAAAFLASA
jgi:hypothetical protein